MQLPPSSCYFLSSRSKYSPQHHALKYPHPFTSPWVRDQVSHPYETTGKIIALYMFIFRCSGSRQDDKTFLNWIVASTPWI
jgi:hypothetical protein